LHRPFLPSDEQLRIYQEKHYYQNTDPFIFGNNFIYGICQQKMESLRTLESGSLIIFGSRVNCCLEPKKYSFAIDTVFVVKTAEPYLSLDDITKLNLGKYPDIATKFITDKNNKIDPPHGLTLYTGATFDDPVEGMYSFVPANEYDDREIGFPRFSMSDEFYDDNSIFKEYFQGRNGTEKIRGPNRRITSEVYKFWEYIKIEVSKDYVLGVNFKMPEVDDDFHWKEENWNPPVNSKKGSCVRSPC
jgi:hypothetical protein